MASTKRTIDNVSDAGEGEDNSPAKKLKPHFAQSDIITIFVDTGVHQETFYAHRDRLCSRSRFFAGCLNHDFSEAKTREIALGDDDTVAVASFLTWLYTGTFDVNESVAKRIPSIYAFADKICAEEYCNAIVDAYRTWARSEKKLMTISMLLELYARGLRHKSLTRYGVDDEIWDMVSDTKEASKNATILECHEKSLNSLKKYTSEPELAEDIMRLLLASHKTAPVSPDLRNNCEYHEHTEEGSCAARKLDKR